MDLCRQERFVEAAFEHEYGTRHTVYAYRKQEGRGPKDQMATDLPIEPLLEPLSRPENIGRLVEVVIFLMPSETDLGVALRTLLADQLGQSRQNSWRELIDYYRDNEGRLRWDTTVGRFRVDGRIPLGRKLPEGFAPIENAGLANDGFPLRITCLRDGAEMVYVPAGRYWHSGDEGRWVMVGRFYMDRFEVTNAQYRKFCKATGRAVPVYQRRTKDKTIVLSGFDAPRLPVTCVSLEDARAYARWAGKMLPTKGEWLRAAQGDGKRSFPWGDKPQVAAKTDLAEYAVLGRQWPEQGGMPAPVGSCPRGASPFGVEDLLGNVRELIASRTFDGTALAAGRAYNENWPDRVDWTVIDPVLRLRTGSEAEPWTGLRCVLVVSSWTSH